MLGASYEDLPQKMHKIIPPSVDGTRKVKVSVWNWPLTFHKVTIHLINLRTYSVHSYFICATSTVSTIARDRTGCLFYCPRLQTEGNSSKRYLQNRETVVVNTDRTPREWMFYYRIRIFFLYFVKDLIQSKIQIDMYDLLDDTPKLWACARAWVCVRAYVLILYRMIDGILGSVHVCRFVCLTVPLSATEA